jgi:hypothetical protein
MSKRDDAIAQLELKLGNETEAPIDKSLTGKAFKRALNKDVPRTLTAWEWQDYYAEHGKPDSHTVTDSDTKKPDNLSLWKRLQQLLMPAD